MSNHLPDLLIAQEELATARKAIRRLARALDRADVCDKDSIEGQIFQLTYSFLEELEPILFAAINTLEEENQ